MTKKKEILFEKKKKKKRTKMESKADETVDVVSCIQCTCVCESAERGWSSIHQIVWCTHFVIPIIIRHRCSMYSDFEQQDKFINNFEHIDFIEVVSYIKFRSFEITLRVGIRCVCSLQKILCSNIERAFNHNSH